MGFDSIKSKLKGNSGNDTSSQSKPSAENESGVKKLLRGIVGKKSFENEKILGVDITPHYVRICQLKNSYGKWMLTNLASACMENFFRKTDILVNTDSYSETLKDLISKNNIKSKEVAFTVPSSSSIVKVLQFADMSDEDFHEAAKLGAIWESAAELEGGAGEYQIYYKILRHNPAKEAPAEEIPVQAEVEIPQEVPAEEIPVQAEVEIPQEVPADEIPVQAEAEIPQEVPAEEIPVQAEAEIPQEVPAEEIPVQAEVEIPQEVPAEEIPVQAEAEIPQEVPAEEIPVQAEAEIPQEVPAEEIPVQAEAEIPQEVPAEEIPVQAEVEIPQEVPAEEIPVQAEAEIPQEAQAEEIPQDNKNSDNNNTMAEAEGAPAFEESAIISEEVPEEIINEEIPADIPTDDIAASADLGPTMDVLFIATKTADVDMYSDIISKAGLKPVLADIRCLALKHALESYPKIFEEIREPYAFLEFGPDDNYVFVVDGERTDIYNVDVSEDDTINLIYSPEDKDKMSLFIENYANQALQIIKSHQENHKTDAIVHLYANSSAPIHVNDASSEPIMKVFVREMKKHMTGRTIKECDFCSHIEVPEKFAKKVNAEGNISAWATSVGIAMRKLDTFDVQKQSGVADINLSNLLPTYKKIKGNKIKNIASTFMGAIIFILTMSGLALSFISLDRTGKNLASEIESLSSVEAKHQVILENAQKLTILVNQVTSLDDIQASLPSNQPGIIVSFRHISQSYPDGVLLNEVTYKNPNKITIKGISVNDHSILTFEKKLNEKPEIMEVSIRTMETETKEDSNAIPGLPTQTTSIKNFTLSGTVKIQNGQGNIMQLLEKKGSEEENGS